MSDILKGVRVLDLCRYVSGPYCCLMLADMGAEVIKVERPGIGDDTRHYPPWKNGVNLYYPGFNRNKKSVTLNFRSKEGIGLLRKLIEKSDVIVENFRAGTMEKMCLGYEEVKAINPRIIMASISGFGQTGPFRDRAGFDGNIMAMSGLSRITPTGVYKCNGPIADVMSGQNAAFGIMLALYEREKTGKGQYIDVSMYGSAVMPMMQWIADEDANPSVEWTHRNEFSPFGHVKAKDGWLNFNAGPDPMYKRLLKHLDDPILHDPKYQDSATRLKDYSLLMSRISEWAKDKTCDEIETIFLEAGITVGVVATPTRLLKCEHLKQTKRLVKVPVKGVGDITYCAFPFELSEHKNVEYRSATDLGECNEEIYHGLLGLSEEELRQLSENGAI